MNQLLNKSLKADKEEDEAVELEEKALKSLKKESEMVFFSSMNRQKIRQSEIPIEVLFNDTLNDFKEEEAEYQRMPKPIIFNLNATQNESSVRYEIDGLNEVL